MRRKESRRPFAPLAAAAGFMLVSAAVQAVEINDAFLFGDSYTDTGAYVPLTNGTTAAAYMASLFGSKL